MTMPSLSKTTLDLLPPPPQRAERSDFPGTAPRYVFVVWSGQPELLARPEVFADEADAECRKMVLQDAQIDSKIPGQVHLDRCLVTPRGREPK